MIHSIIVPPAIVDAANAAAIQLGIAPPTDLHTLTVPLVPVGDADDAEPTYYGCCGMMPESARQWLETHEDQFPGAIWWRWDNDGLLLATNTSSVIGEPWSWEDGLAYALLKTRTCHLTP